MSLLAAILASPLLLGYAILALVVVILLGLIIWLHVRLRRFLAGPDAKHVGESLDFVAGELKDLKTFREEMEAYLTSVEKRLRRSVQAVHTVRFNPFKGAGEGGNQSFAAAFLDQNGDGLIVSSLYSRDRVSVFAKPLKEHRSEHELSDDEREALTEAKKKL